MADKPEKTFAEFEHEMITKISKGLGLAPELLDTRFHAPTHSLARDELVRVFEKRRHHAALAREYTELLREQTGEAFEGIATQLLKEKFK
jgi:hypothetical protein